MKSIYQSDPELLPDSEFIKGTLAFLVQGNKGRLLDARRTPVQIDKYLPESGLVHIKILKFEDEGSIWELSCEEISGFQFEKDAKTLNKNEISKIKATIQKLDKDIIIEADSKKLQHTNEQVDDLISQTSKWIDANSLFLKKNKNLDINLRTGPKKLRMDFVNYMQEQKLATLDYKIAQTWAIQSGGEIVKSLQQTMAEMGLIEYRGKIIRDRTIFKTFGKEILQKYVIYRLAFIRSFFHKIGIKEIILYRGMSSERGWRPVFKSWSSWTPILHIANCHADFEEFGAHQKKSTDSYLFKRTFPIEKIFMTYFETEGFNEQWKETEVIVLHDQDDRKFI